MTPGQPSTTTAETTEPRSDRYALLWAPDVVASTGADTARSARFHIAISRDQGTVVVGVHGNLDAPGARHLGSILDDIIDGQGNMAVAVDLGDASATDPSGVAVFAAAAKRASGTTTSLSVRNPPAPLSQMLAREGLGCLITASSHGGCASPSAPFGRIAAPAGRPSHPVGRLGPQGSIPGVRP